MVDINYNNLFEFITYSESIYDFLERLSASSSIICGELSERLESVYFPYKVVPIIDEMNEEVNGLVSNINSVRLVQSQLPIENDLLIRLIEAYNPTLHKDYILCKYVIVN